MKVGVLRAIALKSEKVGVLRAIAIVRKQTRVASFTPTFPTPVRTSWGLSLTWGATVCNPARPQVADRGTAPRYRSQVIILADQLVIAVEDEVGQAGGAAVLFKCLLNPLKELSGNSRCLNNL